MSDTTKQYTTLYGPFVSGEFPIGSEIPGEGQVIWSYLSDEHNLIYVCSDRGAFPTEIAASEVQA